MPYISEGDGGTLIRGGGDSDYISEGVHGQRGGGGGDAVGGWWDSDWDSDYRNIMCMRLCYTVKQGKSTEADARALFQQIISGVRYCHQ